MTTRIAVVVGNPSPNSRTRRVAEDLAAKIAEVTGSEIDETIELAEVTDQIFEWKSDRLNTLTERLATADYAVIATPTYKASIRPATPDCSKPSSTGTTLAVCMG